MPGELVDVVVKLDTMRGAVVVPREAKNIGQDGGTYVFVVGQDNKVSMRPVKVIYEDEEIASVGTALKPGETVVTDGQLRLINGATVVDANAPKPAAAPQWAKSRTGRTRAGCPRTGRTSRRTRRTRELGAA